MVEKENVRGGIGKPAKVSGDWRGSLASNPWFMISAALLIVLVSELVYRISPGKSRHLEPWYAAAMILFIYFRSRPNATTRALKLNKNALELIASGELSKAAELIDEHLRVNLKGSSARSVLLMTRAHLNYLQGNLTEGLSQLCEAQAIAEKLSTLDREMVGYFAQSRAMLETLIGDCASAEQHLKEADNAQGRSDDLDLIKTIFLVRRGDYSGAEQLFVANPGMVTTSPAKKFMMVLRAFSLSRLDAAHRQSEIEELIRALDPKQQGEFNYLTVKWPELKSFLIEQKLSAAE